MGVNIQIPNGQYIGPQIGRPPYWFYDFVATIDNGELYRLPVGVPDSVPAEDRDRHAIEILKNIVSAIHDEVQKI